MARYDVKDINGNEIKDLEEDAVAALVNQDLVTGTCPMKKSIMREWKTAKKFEFLTNPLADQEDRFLKAKDGEGGVAAGENAARQELAKAEDLKYRPIPAAADARGNAFKYDFLRAIVILIPLLIIAILAIYLIPAFTQDSLGTPTPLKAKKNFPTSFAQLDSTKDFSFGSVFESKIDENKTQKYICLNATEGNAVWCKAEYPANVFIFAFFVFFFCEILILGYPLCLTQQTKGMAEYNIILENAKDTRIEVVALQALGYIVLNIVFLPIGWILGLAIKRTPSEMITYTRCAKLPE